VTALRAAVDDYLAIRRRLGFELVRAGRLLPDLVGYLEQEGAEHLTTELALAWATLPADAHPAWWRQRLGIVRGFARHLQSVDPQSEVPPDVLRAHWPRVTPYLYAPAEIVALMDGARGLAPPLRAATCETVIGLMAVSGLRLGETVALDRADVDLVAGILHVRRAKNGTPREVPLDDSTIRALGDYGRLRDRHRPEPATRAFFVSGRGRRATCGTFQATFRTLVRMAGLEGRGERCRPRPHDLRHTFAVTTLLDWYRAGIDVDARLPLLSTYLGHVHPGATYWYLQATPELLALAGQRLEDVLRGLP